MPGDRRANFVLAEHASLQEKIRHVTGDLYRTETIVPLAIGVIYAWLYGDGADGRIVPDWMWWVPVLIAIFGAIRQHLRYKALWAYHRYVRSLELEIYGHAPADGPGVPFGWETYWREQVSKFYGIGRVKASPHGWMRIAFWALIILGAAVLAVQKTGIFSALAR